MGSLLGPVILGVSALAGAGIASATASSNNQAALAFNAAESAAGRQWQEKMYNESLQHSREDMEWQHNVNQQDYRDNTAYQQELQKQLMDYVFQNYDSPQAQVKALRAAGLNPSVLMGSGKGFGLSGVPSVGSSPVLATGSGRGGSLSSPALLGVPSLENSGAYMANALPQVTGAIKDISSSKLSAAQKSQIDELLPEMLRDLMLKNSGQEIANSYSSLLLELKKDLGNSKEYSEIVKNLNSAYLDFVKGDTEKSLQGLNEMVAKLHSQEYEYKEKLNPLTLQNLQEIIINTAFSRKVMKSQIGLNNASAYAARQQGDLSGANARIASVEAFYKEFEKSYLTSKDRSAFMQRNNSLLMDKIEAQVDASLFKDASDYEECLKRLRQLRKINNGSEFLQHANDFMDWLKEKVPAFAIFH